MARKIRIDALEERIEEAQADLVRAKKKYDASTAMLKQLLDKRQAMKTEESCQRLLKAIEDTRISSTI